MENGQFGSKFKNAKKVRKMILRPHWSGCVQKKRVKKHLIVKKREAFEKGQNSLKRWAIAHAKWSVWVKN